MHNTAYILNVYTEHVSEYLGILMHNRFISALIDTTVFWEGILRIYTTVCFQMSTVYIQSNSEVSRKKTIKEPFCENSVPY